MRSSMGLSLTGIAILVAVGCDQPLTKAPPLPPAAPPIVAPGLPPSSKTSVDALPITTPATTAKAPRASAAPSPVDLSAHVGYKAEGWKESTTFPWGGVPSGAQVFANVPFDISGAIFLWGKKNADLGMAYPEKVEGIPIGAKFETLYICHAAFFESKPGDAVFRVWMHAEEDNATVMSAPIVCGGDSLDWFVKGDAEKQPTNPRSTLGWLGSGKAGERDQPIRFCITALDNPLPDATIVTVDLLSDRGDTAGCIIGMTIGDRGLMTPMAQSLDENAPAPKREKSTDE